MKILQLKTMRGPNYWSNNWQQIIYVRLDIENLEGFPTNVIEGFPERLEALMPSLYQHCCSEHHEGGFFERVREGTWMAHVIEHIALELQWLGGMKCVFGRTRSSGQKGIYNIIFQYEIEEAGEYAVEAAIRIAESLVNASPYDVQADVDELLKIKQRKGLGVSTAAIVDEAVKRGIPFKRLNRESLVVLGQGKNQKRIKASITSNTSGIGIDIACDKQSTKRTLANAYIPVPKGELLYTAEELKEALKETGFPVVIKPVDGNQGRGITTKIKSEEQALTAFTLAQTISEGVIVERNIEGKDFRLLVINHKLVAAAQRTPAMIMGDGYSTISHLIEQANSDPRRGDGHEKVLTTIKVDEVTESILAANNYTLNSVLPIGEILFLKDTANLSTGGTSTDVTDQVHPDNVFMAERISRLINLDICGIDIVAQDISQPLTEENGAIIEVNACPGLRMHLSPAKGLGRNVAEPIVDMLFPEGAPSRIPVIAVTGTNGKTTTTRLTAHIAQHAGKTPGYTTTDGIYINGKLVFKGDCTGGRSAETVLTDPMVDFAVLECARGGILRSGLGFDQCNISIVTNVTEDHLALDGVYTIEDMARVKSVVARSTAADGYAILNAEDDLVYYMSEDLQCRIALFALDANNERIKKHCAKGGIAAVLDKEYITIVKGQWKIKVCHVNEVPVTYNGKAEFMIKNVLPAALAASLSGFETETIASALRTFTPDPEQLPGRLNIFHFRNFDVMVDYAHNPAGMLELKKFIDKIDATQKIGIISAAGDRRDEDIAEVGSMAAKIFDRIYIRIDKDLRGRTEEDIAGLLLQGIRAVSTDLPVQVVKEENDALKQAMTTAVPGSFITTLTELVSESIAYVRFEKRMEETTLPVQAPPGEKLNGHSVGTTAVAL